MRDEPVEGETVTLLVTAADDADRDDLVEPLAAHGNIEDRLRFGTIKVTVPQRAVAEICELPGIVSMETANTLALDPDGAGEDVSYDE